jgi:hypothetical protein
MFPSATGSADSGADWAIGVPLMAAVLTAILAFGWNFVLKRRDEKRELQALVRLLDDELASLQGALEALIRTSARRDEPTAVIAQRA